METLSNAKPKPQRQSSRLLDAWQGLLAFFFGIQVLGTALGYEKELGAPEAPILLFWSAIGAGLLITAAHVPAIFRRWPKGSGKAVYLATLFYLLLWMFTLSEIQTAWEKTPQGAAEAKEAQVAAESARKAQVVADASRRETEALLKEAQDLQDQLQEKVDSLERCFTTFGHRLPALEKTVRESLHNPGSFEHVETVAIVPDQEGNDVAMTFRAENAFGAIRTVVIKAAVVPESCEIVSIQDEPAEL